MSKADGYRLDPVRGARARDETVRRGELAGAVGDARATEAAVARAAELRERARMALAAAIAAPVAETSAAALVRRERFIARRRAELDTAIDAQLRTEAAHAGQLDAVDIARGRLAGARAQRELIERHFAQWRTERRKLAERRED